jgi:WD40 repeat protein
MYSLRAAVLSGLFLSSCFAAAPPAAPSPKWLEMIDRLGDDNLEVRKEAQKKLTALGERILPVLRRAVRTHADVDVRLRAALIASAIERKLFVVRRFDGHAHGVTFLALSPDGKRMVSSSQFDDFSRVWDVSTGKVLLELKGHTKVAGVAWSKDGKHILTAGFDRKLILWDARTGKQITTMTGSPSLIYAVAFTPDGKKAVIGAGERTARVWDLETGKETVSNTDHGSGVRSVAVTTDGKTFVTACFDGGVRLIEVESGKLVRRMTSSHRQAWFVAVSHDGKRAASVGGDGLVKLHDLETGRLLREFGPHSGGSHAIAFSHDDRRLLSGGLDRTARMWDIESGKEIQRFEHDDAVTCAAFLPGDLLAVTSCNDRTLRLWRLPK